MTRRRWTDAEIETLRRLYPDSNTDALAKELGRPVRSVYMMANKFGLKKSKLYMRIVHGSWIMNTGSETRFKAGQTPWNAGIPGSCGHHPNSKAHHFKAGRKPEESRNYIPIGSLRVCDNILQIKMTDNPELHPTKRWIAVHRLIWELEYGPVPSGHVVIFRPGMHTTDFDEISLDRVMLVSRRELMQMNSRHNLPTELNAVISVKARLTRIINKRMNHEKQD